MSVEADRDELCVTCGGFDLHRPWCKGVQEAIRQRDRGEPPNDDWPWWLEPIAPMARNVSNPYRDRQIAVAVRDRGKRTVAAVGRDFGIKHRTSVYKAIERAQNDGWDGLETVI